jgi:hypothetical protein
LSFFNLISAPARQFLAPVIDLCAFYSNPYRRPVNYKQDLLDDKKDEKGNYIPSIKTKIATIYTETEDKFSEIAQYHNNLQNNFTALEKILTDRIETLLPGAGAAGLASAYFEAKSRYGTVPFSSQVKNPRVRFAHHCWHSISGAVRHSINHILFIGPLIAIVWLFVDMVDQNGGVKNALDDLKEISPSAIIFRLLLSAPLGLITWFGLSLA